MKTGSKRKQKHRPSGKRRARNPDDLEKTHAVLPVKVSDTGDSGKLIVLSPVASTPTPSTPLECSLVWVREPTARVEALTRREGNLPASIPSRTGLTLFNTPPVPGRWQEHYGAGNPDPRLRKLLSKRGRFPPPIQWSGLDDPEDYDLVSKRASGIWNLHRNDFMGRWFLRPPHSSYSVYLDSLSRDEARREAERIMRALGV